MIEHRDHHPRRRAGRGAGSRLIALAFVAGALLLPMIAAGPASAAGGGGGGGGGGGAAAATVGNGLTTTDLAAVGMSPTTLASDLVGAGVTVSNVTYSGAPAQAGRIHVVDPAVVSFNDGIILSSGNIADVVGPNKSDGITGDMAGPADADLNALIANTQTVNPVTFDAASLEFDFVPNASTVYFTYTFASDEYLEWVNLFNDVFAFYVNGHNCATVPNGDPVSIDTINSAVNPQLFRDNSFSSPPANPINIESDGLSVEMICAAAVNPGQTNHMKLAIADTSDQILDSVVMIKADSLSTTPPESCNDGVDNDDDTLVDMEDTSCQATTTPPPPGSTGIGSNSTSPPFTGNEGSPITLDGSALADTPSSDVLTTSWTVDGINGTVGSCDISPAGKLPLQPDGSITPVTAICPTDGEYVARVDGWDNEGGSAWDTDVDFFVHNAPPAVTIDAPTLGTEVPVGTSVDLSATVSDPGASDSASCEISWGDGTVEAGSLAGGTCSGSHAFAAAGSPVVSVTATDDAGDSSAAAVPLSVVEPGHVLSDTVTDASGHPVRGVLVQVPGHPAVTTDATGAYAIADVADGGYTLTGQGICRAAASVPVTVAGDTVADLTVPGFGFSCSVDALSWNTTSTVLPLTTDDSSTTVALPFGFKHYGVTRTSVNVSSNGVLTFGAADATGANTALPNPAGPNDAIYGFWDQLHLDGSSAVLANTVGTAPNRRFVVEFRDVTVADDPSTRFSFQVVLYEDPNQRIRLQYRDIVDGTPSSGTGATVGHENAAGNGATQVSFDQGLLFDGLSVRPK